MILDDFGLRNPILNLMILDDFGLRNPSLADLANKTIEENRHLFPDSDVKVVAQLSTQLKPGPSGETGEPKAFDLLVTETFGTLLLGESALAFVSDARHWDGSQGSKIFKTFSRPLYRSVEAFCSFTICWEFLQTLNLRNHPKFIQFP